MIKTNNNDPQDNLRKPDDNASYMKMGTVTSIKKNGCVTKVATEDGKEEDYFVPGKHGVSLLFCIAVLYFVVIFSPKINFSVRFRLLTSLTSTTQFFIRI